MHAATQAVYTQTSTQKCSSKVIAAEDVDGDGHLAFGCAGGDDCDDSDPTIYTGHVETYDGKDNDCNGYIDDWTAEPKGPTSGALATGNSDCVLGVPINGGPGTWLAADLNQTWNVAPFDKKWSIGANVGNSLPLGITSYAAIDAASGPDSACFLDTASGQIQAILVDASGALTHEAAIGPTNNGLVPNYAVTWSGRRYLIAWSNGSDAMSYSLLDPAGNLNGSHSVGSLYAYSPAVGVAANGTSLAVAYQANGTGDVELTLMSLSGAPGDTLDISSPPQASPVLLAVAGVPDGYVVLWSHDSYTYATYVPALNGKPGTPQTFPALEGGQGGSSQLLSPAALATAWAPRF